MKKKEADVHTHVNYIVGTRHFIDYRQALKLGRWISKNIILKNKHLQYQLN